MAKNRKPLLLVIDGDSGTVLNGGLLYVVELTDKQAKAALDNDSDARALAKEHGTWIEPQLLRAVLTEGSPSSVEAVAMTFGWQLEEDNDGQLVLYTGCYAQDRKAGG